MYYLGHFGLVTDIVSRKLRHQYKAADGLFSTHKQKSTEKQNLETSVLQNVIFSHFPIEMSANIPKIYQNYDLLICICISDCSN